MTFKEIFEQYIIEKESRSFRDFKKEMLVEMPIYYDEDLLADYEPLSSVYLRVLKDYYKEIPNIYNTIDTKGLKIYISEKNRNIVIGEIGKYNVEELFLVYCKMIFKNFIGALKTKDYAIQVELVKTNLTPL